MTPSRVRRSKAAAAIIPRMVSGVVFERRILLLVYSALAVLLAALGTGCTASVPDGGSTAVQGQLQLPMLDPAWFSGGYSDSSVDAVWLDWNGDGILDLATANSNGENRLYLHTEATGGLTLEWSFPGLSGSQITQAVAAGDFDGDGDSDLAFGNAVDQNEIWENSPSGPIMAWQAPVLGNFQTAALAWADFDSDGDLDLTVGNSGPLQIFENDPSSPDPFPLHWEDAQQFSSTALAWGDLDDDGQLELASACPNGPDRVYALTPSAQGLVPTLLWTSTALENSSDIAWGDIDGDGALDLVVASQDAGVHAYINDSGVLVDAGIWPGLLGGGGSPPVVSGLELGDWDSDGDLDMVLSVQPPNTVDPSALVLVNDGTAVFSAAWESPFLGSGRAVTWGDRDGDGDLDLALAAAPVTDWVFDNSGSVPPPSIFGETDLGTLRADGLAFGDFDQDGWPDLALARSGQALELFRNVAGTLVPHFATSTPTTSRAVAWGDVDGDGDLDLAVANHGAGGYANHVYENTGLT
ncbi:MAG: VCBS repeat-containing protein, partial [Myxococcota bacterium]|nr:VCBS repeat-containing protein [Myxococcota bacterium]